MRRRTLQRWAGLCMAALGLSLPTGCLSFCHPVEAPPPSEIFPCHEVPQPCKNHVHVFLLHGLDPLDLGNLRGLREYLHSLGFIKTYYGQPFHAYHLETELRKVRAADPEARFVLIGFSYGAGLVRDLALSVQKDDIPIELVVYIDGVRMSQNDLDRPANVARVINVLAFDRGDASNVAEAENHLVTDAWHFGTPTHRQTLRLLGRELGSIAAEVPFVQVMPGAPAPAVTAPPQPSRQNDAWGFLRPDEHAKGAEANAPTLDAWGTPPSR